MFQKPGHDAAPSSSSRSNTSLSQCDVFEFADSARLHLHECAYSDCFVCSCLRMIAFCRIRTAVQESHTGRCRCAPRSPFQYSPSCIRRLYPAIVSWLSQLTRASCGERKVLGSASKRAGRHHAVRANVGRSGRAEQRVTRHPETGMWSAHGV